MKTFYSAFLKIYVTPIDLLNFDLCIWDTNILISPTKHNLNCVIV